MAAVPGGLVPLTMPPMVAAAAAAVMGAPQISATMIHPVSTAMLSGLPAAQLTVASTYPTSTTCSSSLTTTAGCDQSPKTNGDGSSVVSMSPSRSLSSASPPTNSSAIAHGGPATPNGNLADDEKSTAEFIKELQSEKESLESTSDETLLKSHTIKLLDQGKLFRYFLFIFG